MTRRAFAFILGALTMLAAALATGSPVYLTLFIAMGLMMLTSLLSVLVAIFTSKVGVSSALHRIERGGRLSMTIRARHFSPLPVKSMQLCLFVPDNPEGATEIELNAPRLSGRTYEYMLACPHRGVFSVGVKRVRVVDLFEFFSVSRAVKAGSYEVTVSPRELKRPPLQLHSGDTGSHTVSHSAEDAASPSDVRQWLSGDPLKKIHWKLSMRKRELMVRTYEESARPDTLILPDLSPLNMARSFALSYEDAICETALSVTISQLSAMYPVRMPLCCASPVELEGQSGAENGRFVEALARVPFDSPYPYEQVLALEMRRVQRTGGIVLVTSRLTARVADIAMQMRRTGVQMRLFLVSDGRRPEVEELVSRLALQGVGVERVNPWDASAIRREEKMSG